jgi:thioredoxin-related protein
MLTGKRKSMLKTLFIPTLMIISLQNANAQEAHWFTNYDEAVAQAEKENKQILMSFSGSDWCGNCMRLEKDLFDQSAFSDFATSNLVLLKLDFPAKRKNMLPAEQTKHNEKLAEQYNKAGKFPTVLVLDAKGKVLGTMKHPSTDANGYIASLKSIIGK